MRLPLILLAVALVAITAFALTTDASPRVDCQNGQCRLAVPSAPLLLVTPPAPSAPLIAANSATPAAPQPTENAAASAEGRRHPARATARAGCRLAARGARIATAPVRFLFRRRGK